MPPLSMLDDLIRRGRDCEILRGQTRDAIRRVFGKPDDWFAGKPEKTSPIWRYGVVEFYFEDHQLYQVFCDHENITKGGRKLRIDPWIVRSEMPRAEFEKALREASIPYTLETPGHDPNQRHVVTPQGTTFCFMEEKEEFSQPPGLTAWWLKLNLPPSHMPDPS